MHWEDVGLIIHRQAFGEDKIILSIFTKEHGVCKAMLRRNKRHGALTEIGQLVRCVWQGRLPEQLGQWTLEPLDLVASKVLNDPNRLAALASCCQLLQLTLPEHAAYPWLYAQTQLLLEHIGEEDWQQLYILWEVALLSATGFGLDLRTCAATGVTTDLVYVSPKSGRAVSMAAGEPYKDKLLPLPAFLLDLTVSATPAMLADGVKLTGYFLQHAVLAPHNRQLPVLRGRIIDIS